MATDTEQETPELDLHDARALAVITAAVAVLAVLSWAYLLL